MAMQGLPPLNGATPAQLASAIHRLARGAGLNTGTFTLASGPSGATVVTNPSVASTSQITFIGPEINRFISSPLTGPVSATLPASATTTTATVPTPDAYPLDKAIIVPTTTNAALLMHNVDYPIAASTVSAANNVVINYGPHSFADATVMIFCITAQTLMPRLAITTIGNGSFTVQKSVATSSPMTVTYLISGT